MMIRILDPAGQALFDVANGGGFFVKEDKEMPYTLKESILFKDRFQIVSNYFFD